MAECKKCKEIKEPDKAGDNGQGTGITHTRAWPKTRKIPGSNNEEEDVEDIVGEEDMMDGVLEVDDNRRVDSASEIQTGSGSPNPDDDIH